MDQVNYAINKGLDANSRRSILKVNTKSRRITPTYRMQKTLQCRESKTTTGAR